ncbi:hypothetical protein D3C84_973110 [compost metagenome]
MLTQHRRGAQVLDRCARQLDRTADRDEVGFQGMGNVDQHVARQYLWFVQRLGNAVDGPYRYALRVNAPYPLIGEPSEKVTRQDGNDLLAVADSVGVARETRIFRQLWQADGVAQCDEL